VNEIWGGAREALEKKERLKLRKKRHWGYRRMIIVSTGGLCEEGRIEKKEEKFPESMLTGARENGKEKLW